MTTDSGLRDIKIFPEELGKIFEQAYKDLPGVSRGAIHSLVLRGVKYATTTPCANCERLEAVKDENKITFDALYANFEHAKKQLEMCIEALKLGTEHPETGGVFWRENILAKLEKE